MKVRTVEIWVGAFIILGISSLLLLAIQVSGVGQFWSKEPGYDVHIHFLDIGGLKSRAKVSMAGVPIGRVQSIKLDPHTYEADVTIRIKRSVHTIPDDSEASILTAGLLGDNFISLSPGFSDDYLKNNSKIPVEQTHSAVLLEQLLSKFAVSQTDKEDDTPVTTEEKQVLPPKDAL